MSTNKLLAIGECMLELSGDIKLGSAAKLNFGGDVLNTALYYSRLGGSVSFFTALGDDDFSFQMINSWNNEDIDTTTVLQIPNSVPGLYAIQTDTSGERKFYYWREQAPIKQLFNEISQEKLMSYCDKYDHLYFSGISISRWDDSQLETFVDWLKKFREPGSSKQIIFDLNYRVKCWKSSQVCKKYLEKILKFVTIVITTFDDEKLLFNDSEYKQTLDRYSSFKIPIVIIKDGANPTILRKNDTTELIYPTKIAKPNDTTAAGDSFNAAFLAAYNIGKDIKQSIKFAQSFASEVIQHQGAIIESKHTNRFLNILKELN